VIICWPPSAHQLLRGAGAGLGAAAGARRDEGKNVAFGTPGSSLFAASTTVTSTGAVNSFHDSFTPFGGGIALFRHPRSGR